MMIGTEPIVKWVEGVLRAVAVVAVIVVLAWLFWRFA